MISDASTGMVELQGGLVNRAAGGDRQAWEGLTKQYTGVPVLGAGQRRRLLDGDGRGQLVPTGRGRAELAVEVIDVWQRRGVGTRLLRQLRRTAEGLATSSSRPRC